MHSCIHSTAVHVGGRESVHITVYYRILRRIIVYAAFTRSLFPRRRKIDRVNGHWLPIIPRDETLAQKPAWHLLNEENLPCERASEDSTACLHKAADKSNGDEEKAIV